MKKQIIGVLLSTALLAGCATDRERTQAEGTGVGTLLGAAAGAAGGAIFGGGKGAAIGAGAGAALGALGGYAYGTHVANQKAKFAREEDYLDAVIANARQTNEQMRQYNASLRNDVSALDRETAELVRQYNRRAVTKVALQQQAQRLDAKLAEARNQAQKLGKERDILQGVLAQEQGQAPEHLRQLQAEVANLERQKAEMEQLMNKILNAKNRVPV